MSNTGIKAGDKVIILSGGPVLTVTKIRAFDSGDEAVCVYWNRTAHKFESLSIPLGGLKVATAHEEQSQPS